MTAKILYEKDGEIARITFNRPERKNAIDLEMHHRLGEIWRDFRDDPELRVAIITGTGDAFCAGADLKTHVPEWDGVGPSLGRDKLLDGFAGGITRGVHRIYKPIIAACNGWVLGGGLELAMACDIRIASERAQFGSFELRRGMHPADGGIVRLVNTCGVGIALEMELTGEPIDAQRALACNMVSKVVPHDELMAATEDMVARILRNDRRAVESAKETIFEVIGRTLDEQLKVECLYGYALCGGNPELNRRSQEFLDKKDKGRVGVNASPL
ncbi:enoyl-CoA hydratase/isomerase family protein [uncultured Nevskia sp.]|uniref:enoyl-CoA hydratase/isomerase family protein n=1 Tax=uncultured Nevskia sp. TaxID=228950 RepID=UPI0025F73E9A|nr:enoyl-CoA hydratase/isomerase family protein [uncultured Nevskia sp.]